MNLLNFSYWSSSVTAKKKFAKYITLEYLYVRVLSKLQQILFKETQREKELSNKTPALTKSMNIEIRVVGTSNQLFKRDSYTHPVQVPRWDAPRWPSRLIIFAESVSPVPNYASPAKICYPGHKKIYRR